jgi:hypothetical protein
VYEVGRGNSIEVDDGDVGLILGDGSDSYVCEPTFGPSADEARVEGTTDGALYGFVEEKYWLAK